MDILPRSGERRGVALRADRDNLSRDTPDRASLTVAAPHPRVVHGGGITPGITAGSVPRDRARSTASEDAARRALSNAADRLLAEARAACIRDAVPANKQELLARVAARIGLSQSEVTQALRLKQPRRIAQSHVDDRIVALAACILGRREHAVFLARRNAPPNDASTLHRLATELGVSIERIYQLEASALHKLATALR